jgi:hypothetical protein
VGMPLCAVAETMQELVPMPTAGAEAGVEVELDAGWGGRDAATQKHPGASASYFGPL